MLTPTWRADVPLAVWPPGAAQEESSLPSKPKKAAPKKDKKPVEKPAGPGALAAGGGLGAIPLHSAVEVESEEPVQVRCPALLSSGRRRRAL